VSTGYAPWRRRAVHPSDGKRTALVLVLGAASLLAASTATAAEPGAGRRRVVVGGPQDDPIAARVHQELTALGFEAVRVGALDGCARSAVVVAAKDEGAIAATCSDGDQVGVWVSDGATLRLQDVIASHDEGEGARETTAVRAAEVTRAAIAMREAEEEGAARKPPSPPASQRAPADVDGAVVPDVPPKNPAPAKSERRTPIVVGSVGLSGLLGVDASVSALSAQIGVGILRNVAATARVELALEEHAFDRNGARDYRVAPSFVGAGVEVPLAAPTAFMIPRFGAGLGVAWISATEIGLAQTFEPSGAQISTTNRDSDSAASPAGYASAGLSMRLFGPMRFVVDGILGTTLHRLVARDEGDHVAYWGQPFGALALRLEVMIR